MSKVEYEMEYYIKEFKASLQARQKEESTIKMYINEIRHFLESVRLLNIQLSHISQEDIILARNLMIEKGMKPSTINKSISILSSFFKWAKEQGFVATNPTEHIRLLEPKKTIPPKWLTEEDIARLLQYVAKERNSFKKTRNEALIYVMLYAGLRVEEVSELRLASLQEEALIVFDNDAESRRVPIDEMTRQILNCWMDRRLEASKQVYDASPYLFVTERSGCMQPRSIQFVIESFSLKLGFLVLCQHLRHTYCRRLAVQGIPIEQIKKWAGHKSILTTYQYIDGQ